MKEHEQKFQSYYRLIRTSIDDIQHHQKEIYDLKDFRQAQLKVNERAEERIKKNKL
jgi:hypothetical protein